MYRKLMKPFTFALTSGLLVSSLALAATTPGSVTAIDKGMATIRTSDGKDHQMKAGDGWKVGAKVDCETKDGKFECRPASPSAAVQPPAQPQGHSPAQPMTQPPAQSQVQQPTTSQTQQPAMPKAN